MPRSLQFDADSQRDNSSDPQSSERPVPSSLLHLVGQMAETAEDKYRLLEQRDKILRQGDPPIQPLLLFFTFVFVVVVTVRLSAQGGRRGRT